MLQKVPLTSAGQNKYFTNIHRPQFLSTCFRLNYYIIFWFCDLKKEDWRGQVLNLFHIKSREPQGALGNEKDFTDVTEKKTLMGNS